MYGRKLLPFLAIAVALVVPPTIKVRAAPAWVEQGPGPIFNGQDQGLRGDPVAGAVNAVLADPRNADRLLVGTVNGGIWATTNATGANPRWRPLTDRLPGLSISSLAVSLANPTMIFGGTGSTSSFGGVGSPGFGVLRSIDRGVTWQVLAKSTFAGKVIDGIVPTRLLGGAVVLAATRRFPAEPEGDRDGQVAIGGVQPQALRERGLFRSTNAAAADPTAVTFRRVSGVPGTGLPEGGVSGLIADPSNPRRFYAGVSADDGAARRAGVYRSDNGGATWRPVDGSGALALTGLANSVRILLAIHADRRVDAVYAAVIGRSGGLTGVFRSADQGRTWTSLGFPVPVIFPGRQGDLHGALVADPIDPHVAFIAGDRQDGPPFPNANGCDNYVASIFRLDAAQPRARRWQLAVCDGANGTAPHADSRAMSFDANGDLLQANDGGVYRLANPNQSRRRWVSVIGDVRPTEFHSVAYDPLSKVIIGGAQDNGNAVQTASGSFAWNTLSQGDGGVVAVDADQRSHPGTTLRYTSAQFFDGFVRTAWNRANRVTGARSVGLDVVSGRCAGRKLTACDRTIQFYTPFVLDAVAPLRMLIGTNSLYESLDRGERLRDLTGNTGTPISGLVYGGRRAGRNFPGLIYAGDGTAILHRISPGGAIVALTYPGDRVRALVANPFDYRQIVVLDDRSRVWMSADEGTSWSDLTGNLASLTGQVGSIGLYSPNDRLADAVLIAGGFGVFQQRAPGPGAKWTRLGTRLPNALFLALHYDYRNDLLLAGSLGRGAWTLSGYFRGGLVAAARPAPATPPAPYGLRLQPTPPLAAPAVARSAP